MGRNHKITAAEVLELLLERGQITITEMAELFGVHPETIRSRLRELRRDGEAIIHGMSGVMCVTREEIENDENMRDSMRSFVNWILRVMEGIMTCAKPTRPLLPTLRRTMKESLSTQERRELALSCVRIKGLLDYIETEEEDDANQGKVLQVAQG